MIPVSKVTFKTKQLCPPQSVRHRACEKLQHVEVESEALLGSESLLEFVTEWVTMGKLFNLCVFCCPHLRYGAYTNKF